MEILSSISLLSLLLFLIYDTNVIIEYSKKFNIPIPYKIEYLNIINNGGLIHYLEFLHKQNISFFYNLIGCFICSSVWLSLFISLITYQLIYCPIINFFGLIGYLSFKLLYKASLR